RRVEMELARLTDQVAGGACEVLPFPLIHMRPDHVAVASAEFGVDVQQRLNVVIADRNVFQADRWKPGRGRVDGGGSAGPIGRHVDGEDGGTVEELITRLLPVGS